MNSLERLVGILDQFDGDHALVTAEHLHERLGYTRSTLYRYLKVLTDAGLLASYHGSGYTLGPRIIELDFRIRARDPLLAASRPLMRALTQEFEGIALLCRRYKDRVLCVHQETSTEAFQSHFDRGQLRSLYRGAVSRVILAHLPGPHLRKLYAAQADEFARFGIGRSLEEVRSVLRRVRQQGFAVSSAQMTPGVTGIAAPILDSGGSVLGSVGMVVEPADLVLARQLVIAERVIKAAAQVSAAIAPAP